MLYGENENMGFWGFSMEEKLSKRAGVPVDKVKIILAGYKAGLDIPKAKYPDPGMVEFIKRYSGFSDTIIKPVLDQFTDEADRASLNAKKNLSFTDQIRRVLIPVAVIGGIGLAAYSLIMFSPFIKK